MSSQINKISKQDLNDLADRSDAPYGISLSHYQEVVSKSAIYPGRDSFVGLIYTAGKMVGEAGELNEKVMKAMRDDPTIVLDYDEPNETGINITFGYLIDPERRNALRDELGDVLWYWVSTCRELGFTVDEIMIRNVEKLYDRQERGVLQGSGDNR